MLVAEQQLSSWSNILNCSGQFVNVQIDSNDSTYYNRNCPTVVLGRRGGGVVGKLAIKAHNEKV